MRRNKDKEKEGIFAALCGQHDVDDGEGGKDKEYRGEVGGISR